MDKLKFNLIAINLFFLTIFNNNLFAVSNVYIVTKVDNEIITNIDIAQEVNYLISLNNDLINMEKKSLVKIAKDSLIREKIKLNELNKNNNTLEIKQDVMENILKNYYEKLNLDSLEQFREYLLSYNINLQDIMYKIKIEILWNQYVYYKYKKLLNVNVEELKKKINENKNKNNKITKYLLSEILFSLNNEENFEKKNSEIRQKIDRNGFKTAANIYSISSTAKFGGRIGLMNESQLSKKILKEIKSIKQGEVTKTIDVPNGFLILKLEDIIVEKFEKNLTKELDNLIKFETNRQLNQFSIIYFNKLKINSKIVDE